VGSGLDGKLCLASAFIPKLVCKVNSDLWSLKQVDAINLFQIQSPRGILGLSVLIKSKSLIAHGKLLAGIEPAASPKH